METRCADPSVLLELAGRVEAMRRRILSVMENHADMPTSELATAIAAIVTRDFGTFPEVSACLRALAAREG